MIICIYLLLHRGEPKETHNGTDKDKAKKKIDFSVNEIYDINQTTTQGKEAI